MENTITIPDPDVLAEEIRAREEELTKLKRLRRLSLAARRAEEARQKRVRMNEPDAGKGVGQ